MKYTISTNINLPKEKVKELLLDTENYSKWQPGLIEYEHLSGREGTPGARARLRFKMGKRNIEMLQKVLKSENENEFRVSYETKGVYNIVINRFEELPHGGGTKYSTDQEFRFRGFMRVFGLLMPGAFKKESLAYMERFRDFAEGNEKKVFHGEQKGFIEPKTA